MSSDSQALLIIDVQNDFCPGGSLGVPDGDQVVPPLNSIAARFAAAGRPVLASRDWHPAVTSHFQAWGGVWPPHCVQNTRGAEFHPHLKLPAEARIVSKGDAANVDCYSAFEGHLAEGDGLHDWLQAHDVKTLVVGGLATDYCVKSSVLDALRHGYEVYVLQDAMRGVEVHPGDTASAETAMREAGAHLVQSPEYLGQTSL
jgi:nicotinamidase/pyrazinamidase